MHVSPLRRALARLVAAVLLALLVAGESGAATFVFDTPISGDVVEATASVEDTAPDTVRLTVSVPPGAGDILGLFGSVLDEGLASQLSVIDSAGIVSQWQFQANQVKKVGGGNTMQPVGSWDWGVKLGASGSPGGAVVESASFELTAPGLDAEQILGAATEGWMLGVRVQSTSGPEGSSKLGLAEGTPPLVEPPSVTITSPEDGLLTGETPVAVTGTVTGDAPVEVDVDGVAASVTSGSWTAEVPLAEGANTLVATATNDGGSDTESVTVTLDSQPPVVEITTPPDGHPTTASEVPVEGTVTDASPIDAFGVGGAAVPLTAVSPTESTFSTTVPLSLGTQSITARATDAVGNAGSDSVSVVRGEAPQVSISAPEEGALTTASTISVSGIVSGTAPVAVEVNGVAATVSLDAWSAELPLELGENAITAQASNAFGTDAASVTVTRGEAPTVSLTSPADGLLTNQSPVTVSGTVSGTAPVTLQVNGTSVAASGGTWSTSLALAEGSNLIEVVATNAFGSAADDALVTLDTEPPSVAFSYPPDGSATADALVPLAGTVVDASPIAAFEIDGEPTGLEGALFFRVAELALGENVFTATATDAAGNTGSAEITVARGALPEVAIASPEDGSLLGASDVTVTGTVAGDAPLQVDVNGEPASVTESGFSAALSLAEGEHTLTATASNVFGEARATATVTVDTTPPEVRIVTPADGATLEGATTPVTGEVFDASPIVGLSLDGAAIPPGNTFGEELSLAEGANAITAEATDAAGNAGSATVTVTRAALDPLAVEIFVPSDGSSTSDPEQIVKGTVSDPDAAVEVNGFPAAVHPDAGGSWVATVPLSVGPNALSATATRGEETATDEVTVTRFEEPAANLRLVLLDDERSPKEGFGTSAEPLVAEDGADFRAYLDAFGTPASAHVPRAGHIHVSGSSEDLHLAVFAEVAGSVDLDFEEDHIANGDAFRSLQPIADLSTELGNLGLDPALASALPPSDFAATSFAIYEIELCAEDSGDDIPDGPIPASLGEIVCLSDLVSTEVFVSGVGTDALRFVVDEVSPSAAFTYPPSGATVGGDLLTVMGRVTDLVTSEAFDLDAGGPVFQEVRYEVFDESSGSPVLASSGSAPIEGGGFALTDVPVAAGEQRVRVAVLDAAGNAGATELPLVVDPSGEVGNVGPTITSSPVASATQGQPYAYDVEASDPDGDLLTFSLEGAPEGMSVTPVSGEIEWTPAAEQVGIHTLTVRVEDTGALSSTQTFDLTVGNVNDAPRLTSAPVLEAREGEAYAYTAVAEDPDLFLGELLTFSLDAAPAGMSIDAATGEIAWTPGIGQAGLHTVTVRVTDAAGAFDTQSFQVEVIALPAVTIDSPADGSLLLSGSTTVSGTVNSSTATVTVNGVAAAVTGNTYTATVPLSPGSNGIEVVVNEGDFSTRSVATVFYDDAPPADIPPDPASVAPALDPTVATTPFAATEFLYTGSDPIQEGVDAGTIDPVRTSVLRGRVSTRDEAPLEGATVTVLDHPELGQTATRADGMFDLVTNGGGALTLRFERSGFIPAQRTVEAPAQDFRVLEDVVLVPLDARVTTLDLSAQTEVVVHRGSPVSDADGERQATVLVKPGTSATLELPDGSTQPVETLSIRATEFTVGPQGPEAMPALLPPTSAYTYAVELSADEALAAGASRVSFSQPVTFYLENFLDVPTGEPVPVGFYDRERGVWVPADDGAVVEILAVDAGVADVDRDGDGIADALPLDERTELGALYEAGETLWRVRIPHFTPWDFNWPYNLPPDALGWPGLLAPTQIALDPIEETEQEQQPESEICGGSSIGVENQVFREQVGLAGTDLRLGYSSSRAPGRVANRSARVNVSGESVPESLEAIRLSFEIAGQREEVTLPPEKLQDHRFTWDQRDAYGRKVQGKQPLTARIRYAYRPDFTSPPDWSRSFGSFGDPDALVGVEARQEVEVVTTARQPIGVFDAKGLGLGGWNLSEHHVYDPVAQELHRGDGRKRDATAIAPGLRTVAGIQDEAGHDGNGGPALEAKLRSPADVAVAPDGSLYVVAGAFSSSAGHVRRVRPDGTIETVVGSSGASTPCPVGSTCPAVSTSLDRPRGIAFGPDGSYYIAESGAALVRRVEDAMIRTVAGTGTAGAPQLGVPAESTALIAPRDVAVATDGTLFVLDQSPEASGDGRVLRIGTDGLLEEVFSGTQAPCPDPNVGIVNRNLALGPDGAVYVPQGCRVLRIDPDGSTQTVAGHGSFFQLSETDVPVVDRSGWGFAGDGLAATSPSVQIDAHTLAVGPDGSLFLADSGVEVIEGFSVELPGGAQTFPFPCDGCVRRVTPENVIQLFAGGQEFDPTEPEIPEGSPPLQAAFAEAVVPTAGPNGVLYLADPAAHVVRKVESGLPGFSGTDIVIPSEDGREFYVFDETGRHLSTVEARTNVEIRSFDYDASGRLVSMTDRHGRVTQIQRSGDGTVSSIEGPFGKTTSLDYDAAGQLASIQNPAGDTFALGYEGGDGLLTSVQRPTLGTSSIEYDALGRLTRDEGPAGRAITLERTQGRGHFRVDATDTLGRTASYALEKRATGRTTRAVVSRAGELRDVDRRENAEGSEILADGTEITQAAAPDERFGMLAAVPERTEIELPSGLIQVLEVERSQTFQAPGVSGREIASQTDTFRVNGRSFVRDFDASTGLALTTTPEGRVTTEVLDVLGRPVERSVDGLAPVRFEYDGDGRLAALRRGEGSGERETLLAYDTEGNLQSMTDALSRTVSFEHDSAGRVTRQILADGRAVDFTYDGNGNLTSIAPPGRPAHVFRYAPDDLEEEYEPPAVDADDPRTFFTYGADRQLIRVDQPDGAAIELGYDEGARLVATTIPRGTIGRDYDPDTGNLASITAPGGEGLDFAYDGSLLTQSIWTGTVSGRVSRIHDADFRVATQSVDGSWTTDFDYDDDGLLVQAGTMTLARDPENGLLTATELGSVATLRSYNGFGERASDAASAGSTGLYANTYTRDALGRINRKVETIQGETTTYDYAYDLAGRLTEVREDGAVVASYAYDANGNRLSETTPEGTTSGVYDAQDRLLTYGDFAYTHDGNGDLTSKTNTATGATTQYVYDALGNLTQVTLPDGRVVEYVIDGRNRRVGKKVDGVLVKAWLYQDGLNPVAELDGAGNVVARFVYGSRPNVPDYMVKGGTTYRILSDHLGSPRLVVNAATGAVAQRLDYDAWGEVTQDTNPGFQPFGFAGGIYDRDTRLVRFGVRDYDVSTSRWTSRDPILFDSQQSNLYSYAVADPVNRLDRNGLFTVHVGGTAVGGAGGGGMAAKGWVIDSKGNYGTYETYGAGGYGGIGVSAVGSVGVTNAETVDELKGLGATVGGSIGPGPTVGGEVLLGKDYKGIELNAGGTLSVVPVELHGFGTMTTVDVKGNVVTDISNTIDDFIRDLLGLPPVEREIPLAGCPAL